MTILEQLEACILSADRLNEDGVPAASLAILEDGKITAHVVTHGKETTETVFQACSISKAVAALAVAKLVDHGHIAYDGKVIDHLPKSTVECIVDTKTAHLMQHVTVGMLLSHTSGLSQHGFPGYLGDPPSAEDILAGRAPSNTPRVHFKTFPGAQFSYSGGGFTVLQIVLESVMSKPFPQIMQEVVLKPLGMTRSWYGDLPKGEENYARAHVTASTSFPGNAEYHRFAEHAAASLWSTPSDLLKVVSAIQDSLYTESGFITQQTAKKMLKPIYKSDWLGGMALGWAVKDENFGHAGDNWPGYTSYVFGFHRGIESSGDASRPRTGIALMVNSWLGHNVAIKQIVSAIYYLRGWQRFKMLPSGFGKDDYVPYAAPEGTHIDNAWEDWIGLWGADWQLVDQDGPAWQYRELEPMNMRPAAAPTELFEDGRRELFFVVDGLKIALRLTWEDGTQVVQLLQAEATTLKKRE